jgi:hypothetical protein
MSFNAGAPFTPSMARFYTVAAARQTAALPGLLPPFLRLAVVSQI